MSIDPIHQFLPAIKSQKTDCQTGEVGEDGVEASEVDHIGECKGKGKKAANGKAIPKAQGKQKADIIQPRRSDRVAARVALDGYVISYTEEGDWSLSGGSEDDEE